MDSDLLAFEELRFEREILLRHFEALDAKAGIVMGFAGALATLAPSGGHLLFHVGRVLAAFAALLAMGSFVPRRLPSPDLRHTRMISEIAAGGEHFVGAVSRTIRDLHRILSSKARALVLSMAVMIAAIVVSVSAIIVTGGAA